MPRTSAIATSILVITSLLQPALVLARGGHGGGGGGAVAHFGGGPVGRVGGVARPYGPSYRGYSGHWGGYRGYRWGYPGYAWGYPYYGYGAGSGVGLGLGYGLSSGYSYGYPAYGYAVPVYAYPAPGYVSSSPTSGTTTIANSESSATTGSATSNIDSAPRSVITASATSSDEAAAAASRSREFADRGTSAFKAGNYDRAAWSWRHAIVDDPQNPALVLQLSHALFAIGIYDEAAGAVQAAMRQLPQSEWGTVVTRYQTMYGKAIDYTHQLRALENAINSKPNDPALRFLAAYHFGYLGFVKQSIEQLEDVVRREPRDELARQLLDEMHSKLTLAESISTVPPAPTVIR